MTCCTENTQICGAYLSQSSKVRPPQPQALSIPALGHQNGLHMGTSDPTGSFQPFINPPFPSATEENANISGQQAVPSNA